MSCDFMRGININKNIHHVFLFMLFVTAGSLFFYIMQKNQRWSLYIIVMLLFVLSASLIRSYAFNIFALMATLVFVESFFVSQIKIVQFISVSLTMCVFFVAFVLSFNYKNIDSQLYQIKIVWIVFLLVPLLSILMSDQYYLNLLSEQVRYYQLYFVEFFLFFVLGSLSTNHPKDVNRIFLMLFLLGGVVAILHLFSIATGINLESLRGIDQVADSRNLSNEKNWRYGGVFGNPNTMSAFYVMFAPIGMIVYSKVKNAFWKVIIHICLVLMMVSLFFAGSRSGILLGLLNFSLAFFLLRPKFRDFIFFTLTSFTLLIGGIYLTENFFYNFYQLSLDRYQDKGLDLGVRLDIWGDSLLLIKDNLLGIGLHWEQYLSKISVYNGLQFSNPHNIYLSVALKGGVVGLICFFVILFKSLKNSLNIVKNSNNEEEIISCKCIIVIVVGFMVFGLTEPLFSNGFKINHIIGFVIGVSSAINYTYNKKQDS